MKKNSCQRFSLEESSEKGIESYRSESCADDGRHVYYSEQEAQALEKKLVQKETFREAQHILISWLERKECNKRNSARFVFLMQLCWNSAEKILTELKEYLQKIESVEGNLVNKSLSIQPQVNAIEEIFQGMEKLNVWGNFTQNQVEKMSELKADIMDIKHNILRDRVVEKTLNDCVSSVVEKEEASNMIEYMSIEDKARKLRSKVKSLTYEVKIAREKVEEMRAECTERANEIFQLRAELEERRKSKETNSITVGEGQQHNSNDVASQSNLDQLDPDDMHMISYLSVFLFNNAGVNPFAFE